MKSTPNQLVEPYRVREGMVATDFRMGNNGAFCFPFDHVRLAVVVSDGFGWDHISVSLPNRCPTWEEMEFIRDLFACSDEWWIQLGAPKAAHINNHPYCLHWWRPQTQAEMERIASAGALLGLAPTRPDFPPGPIPVPPSWMVGVKGLTPDRIKSALDKAGESPRKGKVL